MLCLAHRGRPEYFVIACPDLWLPVNIRNFYGFFTYHSLVELMATEKDYHERCVLVPEAWLHWQHI